MAFLIEFSIFIFGIFALGGTFFCLVVGTGQFNTGQPDETLMFIFFVLAACVGVISGYGLSNLYQYLGWL